MVSFIDFYPPPQALTVNAQNTSSPYFFLLHLL